MNKKKLIVVLVLALALPALLSGCGGTGGAGTGKGVDCNWLLKVDQTIPVQDGDVTVNHTLVLIAIK